MANPGGKGESAPTNVRRLAVHGGLVRPSVYIRRSKVTISLEPGVWEAFQEIAAEQGKTVNQLAAEIEQRRIGKNLSAAIRVYIIEYYRELSGRRR
jgi:predicted DNA-binding ribbon-helix-helix protein